jgi:uncharacterized integral membrane protein
MTATPAETPTPRESPPQTPAGTPTIASTNEDRGLRRARHARRARLYVSAAAFVLLLALIVVLVTKNEQAAKLDWVVGSTHASLSWIILTALVLGWLLGIITAASVHRRTRRAR